MQPDYELAVIAAGQAGYISASQARTYLSESAIRWRVSSGTWQFVRRGLYRIPGIASDHLGLLRAAVETLPEAIVSHESAAELHCIPFVKQGLAVVTVFARTTHQFPGVRVHRSLDLLPEHREVKAEFVTTTVARTFVDLAAVMRRKRLAAAIDETLAARLVDISEIDQVFTQVARKGRTGSAMMRQLLEERIGSELITASKLERVGMRLFERGGLPRPVWQFPAPWDPDRRIDFAWPPWLVGVEGDGRRWHSRAADFDRDRQRDRLALLEGWCILRFTWNDFVHRPDEVLGQVRAAISLRQATK